MATDNPTPEKRSRRPLRFLIYTLITIALAFILALAEPDNTNALVSFVVFVVPLGIFVLTVLTYLDCLVNLNAVVLLFLLVSISVSFVLSAALWFTIPDYPRLEPLSTLLALDTAFLGFITSSSGRGQLKLELRLVDDGEDERAVQINFRLMNLRSDDDQG